MSPFRVFGRRRADAPVPGQMTDQHAIPVSADPAERMPTGAGHSAGGARLGADAPTPAAPEIPADRLAAVQAATREWTATLVEAGGPNNLLWAAETPAHVLDLTLAHPAGLTRLAAGNPTRLSDLVREQKALAAARVSASRIRAKARELVEDHGLTGACVAYGTATWTPSHASRIPAAPVLLRACTLRPVGGQGDHILELDGGVEVNPALLQYLRATAGLEIDAAALVDLAWPEGVFAPRRVQEELAKLCSSVPGFAVAPTVSATTFTYSKAAAVADLGALSALGQRLAAHDVVAALAGAPVPDVRAAPPLQDRGRGLVLDTDPDQQAAVEAVRRGGHLVIDAPPGTGATQTIANLISTYAADGRSVLLVTERRDSLRSLTARLDGVGLGGLVVELADGHAGHLATAQRFVGALDAVLAPENPDGDRVSAPVHSAALQALEAHVALFHEPRRPAGVSPAEIIDAVADLADAEPAPRTKVRLPRDVLDGIPLDGARRHAAALEELAELGAWDAGTSDDPWFGADLKTEDDAARAHAIVAGLAAGRVEDLQATMTEVFAGVRLPELPTVSSWGRLLHTVGEVRETLEAFRTEVFDLPLTELVDATAPAAQRHPEGPGWWSRWRLRRQARSLLRPGLPPPDLHAALARAHEQRSAWRDLAGPGGRPEIPPALDVAAEVYSGFAADLDWLDDRLPGAADRERLVDLDRAELDAVVARLTASPERIEVVPRVRGLLEEVRACGLGPLVEDLAARGVPADAVGRELWLCWWSSLADEHVLTDVGLTEFSGADLRAHAATFAVTDAATLTAQARLVRTLVRDRARTALAEHPGAERALRAAAAPDRDLPSPRDLLATHGTVLRALVPCLAVSPYALGALLPADLDRDLVIIDDAHGVATAAAVCAIARGRQVVLVGDPEQPGPASFTTIPMLTPRGLDGSPAPLGVLDAARTVLPVRTLRRLHRGVQGELVTLLNDLVYAGQLRALPGVGDVRTLSHELVDGVGMALEGSSAVESTSAEVERVAELVADGVAAHPDRSCGVLTLSEAHAERIEGALLRAAQSRPDLAAALASDGPERLVVLPVERAGSMVRDEVIVAVGYGRTPHGRVLRHFGALGANGGEHLLSRALTRARHRVTVVSSIGAEDLDPERLRTAGPQRLRELLAALATGSVSAVPTSGTSAPDVPALGRQLARRLRQAGLTVRENVGTGADRVELAVSSGPGAQEVAVETDGAVYAALPTARDRDRLRPAELERLGWRHVRVWMLDLYRDPAREVARIVSLSEHPS